MLRRLTAVSLLILAARFPFFAVDAEAPTGAANRFKRVVDDINRRRMFPKRWSA
jgi:hypothetical protein